MSEQFESMFKNLANGMSRRAALRRFFGGIAGAAAFALTGRRAEAEASRKCAPNWCSRTVCRSMRSAMRCGLHQRSSRECPEGECAESPA